MEDITAIKQKTYGLKQYAFALLQDLEKVIDQEHQNERAVLEKLKEEKDTEIELLNKELSGCKKVNSELEKDKKDLENQISEFRSVISNIKSSLGAAVQMCEGAE